MTNEQLYYLTPEELHVHSLTPEGMEELEELAADLVRRKLWHPGELKARLLISHGPQLTPATDDQIKGVLRQVAANVRDHGATGTAEAGEPLRMKGTL